MKLPACFLLVGALTACGYRPVYSGTPPSVRLSVVPTASRVAEPVALDGVLDGARSVLASEGVLGSAGYPRLLVEVLRVDEAARGITAEPDALARPVTSRGAAIAVTVRGWVQDSVGGPRVRDSGDIRRLAHYAHRSDPRFDSMARREALRAAAYDAGRALARRVLGEPEPAVELL